VDLQLLKMGAKPENVTIFNKFKDPLNEIHGKCTFWQFFILLQKGSSWPQAPKDKFV